MKKITRTTLVNNLKVLFLAIGILWILFFISRVIPINRFGIVPRETSGLIGIITAPFLHATMAHLVANSVSLIYVGLMLLAISGRRFVSVTVWVALLGGLGTWLMGRSGAVHIGASGVIFGQMGYLFTLGLFTRKIWHIVTSVAAILLYGGALGGLLPRDAHVSWEGHLMGLVAGIIMAWYYARKDQ